MENPFEILNERLQRIENLLEKIVNTGSVSDIIEITPKIMTTHTAAAYLDLSIFCIYKLTSSRELPHSKRGKRLYFDKSEMDKWVLENKCWTNKNLGNLANEYLRKHPNKFLR